MDFAEDINIEVNNVTLILNGKPIELSSLSNRLFSSYNEEKESQKNVLITLQDSDGTTWDCYDAAYEEKNIKPLYTNSIAIGNGSRNTDSQGPRESIDLLFAESAIKGGKKMDLALVRIIMHDSKETGKFYHLIEKFPNDFAEEVVYVVDSCYVGKHHDKWNIAKNTTINVILITSSSKDEPSYISSFDPEKFAIFFGENKITAEDIIQFYSKYSLLTPHISGTYDGKEIEYMHVQDFYFQHLKYPKIAKVIDNDWLIQVFIKQVIDIIKKESSMKEYPSLVELMGDELEAFILDFDYSIYSKFLRVYGSSV